MQASPTKTLPRKAAVGFIFTVVMIDIIALGLIIPVLPRLVETMVGGDTATAAGVYGWFGLVWALMQFIWSPLLGAVSDRYGRRPVLLISMAGQGLDYVLMALAPNLVWLLIGRIINGITSASASTGFAYLADITEGEERAGAFGLAGAAFGVGFVIGPALGGVLGVYDPRLPFWAAALACLANAAFGYFFVPESLPPDRREAFRWQKANPIGSLKLLNSHPELLGLAGVIFLYQLAHGVLPAVSVLYTSYRYGWTAQTMGLTLAAVGLSAGLVQAGLVEPAIRWIGARRTMVAGLLCGAAGFSIYGLAPTSVIFWSGIPVLALWGLVMPSVLWTMSGLVSGSEQGQLQGANASVMALSGLFAPILFTQTFAHAIAPDATWHLPGAPYLLGALLLVGAAVLGWLSTRPASGSS
jgi:DHA1 family tetracycline resistance protein-like MFS transporter